MTESACRWMIRIGSLPGVITGTVLLIAAGRTSNSSSGFVVFLAGAVLFALGLGMWIKKSRACALGLGLGHIPAFFLFPGLGYGFIWGAVFMGLFWLAGTINCFIWQSKFSGKAEGSTPVPPYQPADPRPISDEARRMIEGSMSMLSNDIPIFEEDGDPTPDEKTKWGAGIMTPIGLVVWAVYALVTKRVIMDNDYYRPPVEIEGLAVYAFALTLISAALFCHFHYFWGQTPKLYDYYKTPKYTALAVLIVSVFTFLILAMSGS